MKIELRKYFKDQAGYTILAESKNHQNQMMVVRRLAKQSKITEPRIAFALGLGYSAFGIGQRDLDSNGQPTAELSTTVPNVMCDLVMIETDSYEKDHAARFYASR